MTVMDARLIAPPIGEWHLWADWATQVPAATVMNIRCSEVEAGRAVLCIDNSPWPVNPNGATNGGLIAAAADHAGSVAAIFAGARPVFRQPPR